MDKLLLDTKEMDSYQVKFLEFQHIKELSKKEWALLTNPHILNAVDFEKDQLSSAIPSKYLRYLLERKERLNQYELLIPFVHCVNSKELSKKPHNKISTKTQYQNEISSKFNTIYTNVILEDSMRTFVRDGTLFTFYYVEYSEFKDTRNIRIYFLGTIKASDAIICFGKHLQPSVSGRLQNGCIPKEPYLLVPIDELMANMKIKDDDDNDDVGITTDVGGVIDDNLEQFASVESMDNNNNNNNNNNNHTSTKNGVDVFGGIVLDRSNPYKFVYLFHFVKGEKFTGLFQFIEECESILDMVKQYLTPFAHLYSKIKNNKRTDDSEDEEKEMSIDQNKCSLAFQDFYKQHWKIQTKDRKSFMTKHMVLHLVIRTIAHMMRAIKKKKKKKDHTLEEDFDLDGLVDFLISIHNQILVEHLGELTDTQDLILNLKLNDIQLKLDASMASIQHSREQFLCDLQSYRIRKIIKYLKKSNQHKLKEASNETIQSLVDIVKDLFFYNIPTSSA